MRRREEWLGVGLFALALMLLVEFTAVLWLRGLPLEQYFATLDAVSGTVYFALLALFAILPALVFYLAAQLARRTPSSFPSWVQLGSCSLTTRSRADGLISSARVAAVRVTG